MILESVSSQEGMSHPRKNGQVTKSHVVTCSFFVLAVAAAAAAATLCSVVFVVFVCFFGECIAVLVYETLKCHKNLATWKILN